MRRIEAKICGIVTRAALDAAARHGAGYVGFVVFPKSPRAVTPEAAAALRAALPDRVIPVALLVDPDDEALRRVLTVRPGLIQLHGRESPARVAEVRRMTGVPVMKAVGIARAADLAAARDYEPVADRLLFDAKPPKTAGALPGGRGVPFDWRLLGGTRWARPWMLSGGLTTVNVAEAVGVSGAGAVDVSSGVETAPGIKDVELIRVFLETVSGLGTGDGGSVASRESPKLFP